MISRITWIKKDLAFYRSERNSRCAILLVLIQKSIENLDYFSDYFLYHHLNSPKYYTLFCHNRSYDFIAAHTS